MIYICIRIRQLLIIKNSDINLETRTIIGGIKTDTGKDRIIPIRNKILDLISNRISKNKYFICNKD